MMDKSGSEQQRGPTSEDSSYSPLLMIECGETGTAPLFCIPGAGASVAAFLPLTDYLHSDMPVYGLQPRGLDGVHRPHSSIASAASENISALKASGESAPYQLLAHSFGGLIAFEMACQLKAAGEAIGALILLDVSLPTAINDNVECSRMEGLERLIRLMELSCSKSFNLTSAELNNLDNNSQLEALHGRMKQHGLISAASRASDISGMVDVFIANMNCMSAPSQVYDGKLVVLKAKEARNEKTLSLSDYSDEWKKYATDLTVLEVPGNHLSMLKEPNVEQLALCIHAHLSS